MNPFAIAILCVIAAAIGGWFGFLYGARMVAVHLRNLSVRFEEIKTENQEMKKKLQERVI